MKFEFDYSSDCPSLIVIFDCFDDLVDFLVGFWELI